jgi:hypothetical protein
VIALLGIYSKERKSGYNRDTCTPMFIAALFTINQWKQPTYPTTDEWIRNIYSMEFYPNLRNNNNMWFEGKWV